MGSIRYRAQVFSVVRNVRVDDMGERKGMVLSALNLSDFFPGECPGAFPAKSSFDCMLV